MKKACLVLLLSLCSVFLWGVQKDFIVLLDTSESMFDSWDQLLKVYFPDVVKGYLQPKDVFHLVSFSDQTELELTQKIDTKADYEVVLKRLLVLQALGKNTDTVLAFRFLYQYASGLPAYQPKTIVILTNGTYNPATGALAKADAEKEINGLLNQMKTKGWDIHFVLIRNPNAANITDKHAISLDLSKVASDLGIHHDDLQATPGFSNKTLGSPQITYPKDFGKIGKRFHFSFTVENSSEASVILKLRSIFYGNDDILADHTPISLGPKEKKSVSFDSQFKSLPKEGIQSGQFNLTFDDDERAYPTQGVIRFEYTSGLEGLLIPLGLGFLVILVIAGVILAVIFVRKGYEQGKVIADKHIRDKQDSKPAAVIAGESVVPILQPVKTKLSAPVKEPLSEVFSKEAKLSSSVSTTSMPQATATPTFVKQEGSQKVSLMTPEAEQPSANFMQEDTKNVAQSIFKKPDETNKYKAFESLNTKKDYSDFMKKTESPTKTFEEPPVIEKKVEKEEVVQIANVTPVIPGAKAQDFSMLVWTPDFCFQNTKAPRNIFKLAPGDKKTVGARGNFKITMVSLDDIIAEVVFDGKDLNFYPVAKNLFPELKEPLMNCTGKDIAVLLGREKFLYIRFLPHISKTEELNTILRSINTK